MTLPPVARSAPRTRSATEIVVAAGIGAAFGIFAFAAVAGLSGSLAAGVAAGTVTAIVLGLVFALRPVVRVDPSAASGRLKAISALAAVAALLVVGRLSVFIASPERTGWSVLPSSDWEVRHSCVSAYYVAAAAASATPNVYDPNLYNAPDDDRAASRKARRLGLFKIDVYEYPPPFLALPRLLRVAAPDFVPFRALWFGTTCAAILLGMLFVCRALGGAAATRAVLLLPLVWVALPTLSTLQKGNVQMLVVVLSMVAMLLFAGRRFWSGGALLAFATVSKLYPGMLAVLLLARREWRALSTTAALTCALVVVTVIDLGTGVFRSFGEHLPGLLGGEAFAAFRFPPATAVNFSVPGLVFKLKLFGVPGMGFPAAKAVGWLYTLVALWGALVLARRPLRGDPRAPLAWLGLLVIATLRSPFLPQAYAAFPPLWLLTLLAATAPRTAGTAAWTAAAWVALNVFVPLDAGMDPRALALVSTVPQAVTIALAAIVVRQALAIAPAPLTPGAAATTPCRAAAS